MPNLKRLIKRYFEDQHGIKNVKVEKRYDTYYVSRQENRTKHLVSLWRVKRWRKLQCKVLKILHYIQDRV